MNDRYMLLVSLLCVDLSDSVACKYLELSTNCFVGTLFLRFSLDLRNKVIQMLLGMTPTDSLLDRAYLRLKSILQNLCPRYRLCSGITIYVI